MAAKKRETVHISVYVTADLAKKIDKYRGKVSRSKFAQYCMERALGMPPREFKKDFTKWLLEK